MWIVIAIIVGICSIGFLQHLDERDNLKRNKRKYGDDIDK
jgi:hypothetical protein